jgi:hypothetical protein
MRFVDKMVLRLGFTEKFDFFRQLFHQWLKLSSVIQGWYGRSTCGLSRVGFSVTNTKNKINTSDCRFLLFVFWKSTVTVIRVVVVQWLTSRDQAGSTFVFEIHLVSTWTHYQIVWSFLFFWSVFPVECRNTSNILCPPFSKSLSITMLFNAIQFSQLKERPSVT